MLALDDVQWCDEASAELLHFVARKNRPRPVLIVLGGRDADRGGMRREPRSVLTQALPAIAVG